MKKKWIFIIGLAVVIIAVIVFCLTNRKDTSETINVGVRADVADWGLYDEKTGNCNGMEAEFAAVIAERMKCQVNYIPVSDEDGIEKLRNKEVDCLMFRYTSEESSDDDIAFSETYYTPYTAVFAKASTLFTSLDDLSGKPVAVLSTHPIAAQHLLEYFAEAGLEEPVLYPVDDWHLLGELLETGEVSAICGSDDITYSVYDDECIILSDYVGEQTAAIAVLKDDPKGKSIIDTMNVMIEDGTVAKIADEWGWLE